MSDKKIKNISRTFALKEEHILFPMETIFNHPQGDSKYSSRGAKFVFFFKLYY